MDHTIYDVRDSEFTYRKLKPDFYLNRKIRNLPGVKILFTNGTHQHTINVLSNMKLESAFDLILDRETLGTLKPDPQAYKKLIQLCSINETDTCYYFEDSIYNLIVGCSLGWQTILIYPHSNKLKKYSFEVYIKNKITKTTEKKRVTINYSFQNIHNALDHFVQRI